MDWPSEYIQDHDRQVSTLSHIYNGGHVQSDPFATGYDQCQPWDLIPGGSNFHIAEPNLNLASCHDTVFGVADISIYDLATERDAHPWHPGSRTLVYTGQDIVLPQQYNTKALEPAQDVVYSTDPKDTTVQALQDSELLPPNESSLDVVYATQNGRRHTHTGAGLKRKASTCAPSESQSQVTSTSRRRSTGPIENCSICQRPAKNRSDATKHSKTHAKPYKCRVADCKKSVDGFGTPNDCQRHERCTHKIMPANTVVKGYVCSACTASGGSSKWWLRLDNFKAHLTRIHKDMDAEQIITLSVRDCRPADALSAIDETGSAVFSHNNSISHADNELQYQHVQPYQHVVPLRTSMTTADMQWLEGPGDDLAQIGNATQPDFNLVSTGEHSLGTYPVHQQHGIGAQMQLDEELFLSEMPVANVLALQACTVPSDLVIDYKQPDTPCSKHFMYNRSQSQDQLYSGTVSSNTEAGPVCRKCGFSGKEVNGKWRPLRQCDLTKHDRNVHEKPYGCTHPLCWYKGNSKHDWRRHEQKKHPCMPGWLCRVPMANGKPCHTYFPNEVDSWARRHLRVYHPDITKNKRERLIKEYRLYRKGQTRFWCGFCNKVLDNPAKTAEDAWTFRMNHIGEHMDQKGGRSIDEYICPELQVPKFSMPQSERDRLRRLPPPSPPQGEDVIDSP